MRLREFAKLDEIKKGAKDSNGFSSCWTGYHAAGTKKGKNGGPVRNCVKNESLGANTHSSLEADLAKKYMELAPSIKKYKDEEGADHLYQELLAIARHHGAERKFIHMCNGARNSAHMDYDTNPGHFKNWFWYLGLGNEQGDNDIYDIIRTDDYGKKDFFAGNYSLEQAKDELAKCLAHPLHTKYGHKFAIVKRNEQPIKEFAPGGAKQAAIAIAKKASGKYTKDGKRLKEGSRSS
jgi:hypothetical protein